MKSSTKLCLLVFAALAATSQSLAMERVWAPIEGPTSDVATEARYDSQRPVADFESEEQTWTSLRSGQCAKVALSRDADVHRNGTASLRVDYAFVGKQDVEYIQLQHRVEVATVGLGLGFWMKHDGTPFSLRARLVDASGENHQIELEATAEAGWQFVAGPLDTKSTYWGGDGNGRKDYPCRLTGILFDRPRKGFVGSGSLWIDDVVIVKPRSRKSSRNASTRKSVSTTTHRCRITRRRSGRKAHRQSSGRR